LIRAVTGPADLLSRTDSSPRADAGETARPSTIAIDGPAASGKSTIGGLLAKRLGYVYLDTGVMYRAVTWAAQTRGIAIDDEAAVTQLAQQLRIEILLPTAEDGRQYTVLADGQDVTWAIRHAEVDQCVSPVSTFAGVRAALTQQQRRIGHLGRIVMVGRDIGTVVMPEADLKIYLDATLEERVARRYREMLTRNRQATYQEAWDSVKHRDEVDSNRVHAPLKVAKNAVVIDTTSLSVEDVLEVVWELVSERSGS
jgi:cytidylate kinase